MVAVRITPLTLERSEEELPGICLPVAFQITWEVENISPSMSGIQEIRDVIVMRKFE
jgi:hypothetical protein